MGAVGFGGRTMTMRGGFWAVRDAALAAIPRRGRLAYAGANLPNAAARQVPNASPSGSRLVGGVHDSGVEERCWLAEVGGLRAVPTVMINGTPIVGARPYEEYVKVIEESLAK